MGRCIAPAASFFGQQLLQEPDREQNLPAAETAEAVDVHAAVQNARDEAIDCMYSGWLWPVLFWPSLVTAHPCGLFVVGPFVMWWLVAVQQPISAARDCGGGAKRQLGRHWWPGECQARAARGGAVPRGAPREV